MNSIQTSRAVSTSRQSRFGMNGLGAAAALLVAGAVAVPAYVGQWHSFTDKSRVTALIAHGGVVYAGTQGGIRRVEPGTLAQRDFDNLDGLIDPWITGFAADDAGMLWAVARDGYVYSLAAGGNRWEIHGRGYAAESWRMNDRAVLAAGSHLYLGSAKGLALFDTERKISELPITRFADELDLPVLSLLRRGDTLYVGTATGVYKARVYFEDPMNPPVGSGYANLADHNNWVKMVFAPDPARRYDHLAFIGDSLATFGPGSLLQAPGQSPVRVEAFAGSALVIGSQTYPATWNDYTSAVAAGGKVFVGGRTGLAVSATPAGMSPDAALLSPLRAHPRDTIGNIGANGGVVWGHSTSGIRLFDQAAGIFDFSVLPGGEGGAIYGRNLRNVVVDNNNDVYVGTWGAGLNRVRNGQVSMWRTGPGSCIHEAFPNDPWTVAYAISPPRNGSLFFSVFKTENSADHQLVHYNTVTESIQCIDNAARGGYPHAIRIFADTLVAVGSDLGVNFLVIREGVTGPSIESSVLWTLPGSANEAWDLAADRWGRPWALIGDQLAFVDSLEESTTRNLKPIDNFIGTGCKSLESDPAGFLWVGCGNGLYHVQTDPAGSLTSVRRYKQDDGLPSHYIYDVSVDQANGKVWVATDRGVAMLESSSQPPIPRGNLAVITPFPNPFRPHHAFVIFDKLPVNSTLRIHEASGRVVRIFHPRDLAGNQAQWDGKNDAGKAVKPGVYLFSVVSGSTVQRGKVIVAR
jgi:hypothetical protein